MEPRPHLSSKDSKLKKLTRVFALKRSAFLRIANVRGKQKHISSTTRILYKKQVLTHAKRLKKPDKVD